MIKKLLVLSFFASNAFAQTTIPNLDFESWLLSASAKYEDPTPANIWATPNFAMDLILGNPSTSLVQKSTDAHGGSFAALMKSRNILNNFAGATLFTGFLNTANPLNPVAYLGKPFTGRPIAMKGWYKYTPVNGDSSSIYIKLTKWNTTTNSRDVVGFLEQRDYASVAAYTPFTLNINYTSAAIPDSVTIVFSASAGAEQGLGQEGSSLWIDDVVLDYGANSVNEVENSSDIQYFPNPFTNRLNIQSSMQNLTYSIYTIYGQLLLTTTTDYFDTKNLSKGLYILEARNQNNTRVLNKVISKN